MVNLGYELAMLFFIYSFLGWIAETVVKSLSKKKFVNRGFFTGPFCYIYGFSGVLMSIAFKDLRSQPVFLFLAARRWPQPLNGLPESFWSGSTIINGGTIPKRSGILTDISVFNIQYYGVFSAPLWSLI